MLLVLVLLQLPPVLTAGTLWLRRRRQTRSCRGVRASAGRRGTLPPAVPMHAVHTAFLLMLLLMPLGWWSFWHGLGCGANLAAGKAPAAARADRLRRASSARASEAAAALRLLRTLPITPAPLAAACAGSRKGMRVRFLVITGKGHAHLSVRKGREGG